MKLKTKIGIIGLGIIGLLVVVIGIYWLGGKKSITTIKETKKEILTKETKEELPKKLEPKLVWKKEFDSEIIDFHVWTVPETSKSNLIPITTVQTKKYLYLLDEKGEVKRSLPLGPLVFLPRYSIVVSKNGKYVIEIESKYLGDDVTEEGKTLFGHGVSNLETFRYTTWEGKILWERENIYESEEYGICTCITPQGDRVIVIGDDGSSPEHHAGIWFYNKKGKIIRGYSYKEIRYSEDGLLDGKEAKCDMSGDGNFLVFGYPDLSKKYEIGVILFDKDGNILWKRSIQKQEYSSVYGINISYHGETIYVESDDYIYLYNKKGDLIRKIERAKTFLSPKGDFLVAIFPSFIALIDTLTGKEITRINLKYELCDIEISPKGDFLLVVFPSFVALIDIPTEKEITRINLKYESLNHIAVSPNNYLIAIKERERLYIITERGKVIFKEDILGEECIFSEDSKSLFIKFIKDDHKTIGFYKIEVGD